MMNDGFYLHQWLTRLQALESRLAARLPAGSSLPTRANTLRTQVEQAVVVHGDEMLDGLIENVFLPQLNRLLQDVRLALNLTQHARGAKKAMMTPRQARMLRLGTDLPDAPEPALFKGSTPLKRDPKNREKVDDALRQLKEYLHE
ncbi:MAG: hypothetical protein ACHQAX_07370 [Gammaproteobacteria bacterium]